MPKGCARESHLHATKSWIHDHATLAMYCSRAAGSIFFVGFGFESGNQTRRPPSCWSSRYIHRSGRLSSESSLDKFEVSFVMKPVPFEIELKAARCYSSAISIMSIGHGVRRSVPTEHTCPIRMIFRRYGCRRKASWQLDSELRGMVHLPEGIAGPGMLRA